MNILIVEDNKFFQRFFMKKLTTAGHSVTLAVDGEDALVQINATSPDIILLDLVMPKKDGFAVLQELKASNALKNIPVIIFSTLDQPEDIAKVKALGADYINKSTNDTNSLLAKLTQYEKK